jgi:NADH-quinone oxidoreductase subunit E
VIPVLQYIQGVAGYLPGPAIEAAAAHLRVSPARVFGVASFYAGFHLEPRGANVVTVCRGTACHVRGSAAVLRTLEAHLGVAAGGTTPDGRCTLETAACFGSCALAPVIVANGRARGRMMTPAPREPGGRPDAAGSPAAPAGGAGGRDTASPRQRPPASPPASASAGAAGLHDLVRRIAHARDGWSRLTAARAVISWARPPGLPPAPRLLPAVGRSWPGWADAAVDRRLSQAVLRGPLLTWSARFARVVCGWVTR